jgi:hypothetical protein
MTELKNCTRFTSLFDDAPPTFFYTFQDQFTDHLILRLRFILRIYYFNGHFDEEEIFNYFH